MRLETQVTGLQASIDEHKEEQREDFDKVFKKLDDLDGRFAGKWVEKIQIGVVITIIGAIVSAIIYLI